MYKISKLNIQNKMNSLLKSASIVGKNKQSLQFLKKSIGYFNFSTINKYRTINQLVNHSPNALLKINKKFFWKKDDKKDAQEKPEEKGKDSDTDEKPPKGFEKFHRKKKDEEKKDKDEEPKNNDEDPNKGNKKLTLR
jgi:hypothetical protein